MSQSNYTHANLVTFKFVEQLDESVISVRLTDDVDATSTVEACRTAQEQRTKHIMDQVEGIARQTPPIDKKSSRFGNPAFRASYDEVETQAPTLHAELGVSEAAIPELQTRGAIANTSTMEAGLKSTSCATYNSDWLMNAITHRSISSTYWLEPAGSHGVWGLDDYHFLPFSFGSAQLRTSTEPTNRRVPILDGEWKIAYEDTEKSSFLTSTARSGYINMIVLIIGKGRGP
ncbi:hypothetical protein V8E55_008885 [Tylopilus felleus]